MLPPSKALPKPAKRYIAPTTERPNTMRAKAKTVYPVPRAYIRGSLYTYCWNQAGSQTANDPAHATAPAIPAVFSD
jgi:hypothetical protein